MKENVKEDQCSNTNTHLEDEEELRVVVVLNHADGGSGSHEDAQPYDQQHYASRHTQARSWNSRLPVCAVWPRELASPCNPVSHRVTKMI